jgi:uncharacterized protein YuzE
MAHLYINPDTDSIYLDVTAGDGSPVRTEEPADGVYLHVNEKGVLVAIEVMDLSQRGDFRAAEPEMGHLHVNPTTDSLYLDVSAGARSPANMAPVAEGVYLHVDGAGVLVGIEMMDISGRGGLQVDDLDATPGSPRPPIFDEIERAASGKGDAPSRS